MTIQITLVRSAMEIVNPGDLQGYSYTVTAENAIGMPNEIFRMFNRPLDPTIGTVVANFNGICSPADLAYLPINAPNPPGMYFRVSFISLTFYSPDEGEDQWQSIQDNTTQLIRSLDANALLIVQDTVTIGG